MTPDLRQFLDYLEYLIARHYLTACWLDDTDLLERLHNLRRGRVGRGKAGSGMVRHAPRPAVRL